MLGNWFLKLFPPPKYLNPPVAGLDLSDRSVKFITLKPAAGRFQVASFGERELPTGLIVSGRLQQPDELVRILKELKEAWSLHFITAALPEEQAYVFHLKLPLMRQGELRTSIELQLADYVPLEPTEAIFDYEILAKPRPGEEMFDLGVAAMGRSIVESYLELFQAAGLAPLALEIEGKALVRAVAPQSVEGTFLIVEIGRTRTSFFIASRGILLFTSTIETISGDQLTRAVQKNLNLSYERAEDLKVRQGLLRRSGDNRLFFALLPPVSVLKDEIASRYNYWNNNTETDRAVGQIQKILICGGQSTLPGFIEYLSAYLDLPVELADVWQNTLNPQAAVPPITFPQAQRYATALGLALRGLVE